MKPVEVEIINLLSQQGRPMELKEISAALPHQHATIKARAKEMVDQGLLKRDGRGVYSLAPGVTPESPGKDQAPPPPPPAGSTPQDTVVPLDQRASFTQRLTAIGVKPQEIIPTITDIFFSGDIDDLKWLNRVLTREAPQYVHHQQRRTILSWWAHTRMLPYHEEELPEEERGREGARPEAQRPGALATPLDPGIGWKVDKDRNGDWMALPGGPLTYADALAAAERRAALATYVIRPEGGGVEEEGDGEAQPGHRGAQKPRETLADKLMNKMIDDLFDGRRGGGESDQVKVLSDRIMQMEQAQRDSRFERLEGLVAEMASRDPWDDYERMQQRRRQLGLEPGPVVTDQSPAVQIMRDTADKVDKKADRLLGMFERVALRSEDFTPEETRSGEEREATADKLLSEVQSREKSVALRRKTFGH